jgi:hypothetical protein
MKTAAFHACRCGQSLVTSPSGQVWNCPAGPGPLAEPPPTGLTPDGRTVTMAPQEWRHTAGVLEHLVAARD